jgi:hypothetical protein
MDQEPISIKKTEKTEADLKLLVSQRRFSPSNLTGTRLHKVNNVNWLGSEDAKCLLHALPPVNKAETMVVFITGRGSRRGGCITQCLAGGRQ